MSSKPFWGSLVSLALLAVSVSSISGQSPGEVGLNVRASVSTGSRFSATREAALDRRPVALIARVRQDQGDGDPLVLSSLRERLNAASAPWGRSSSGVPAGNNQYRPAQWWSPLASAVVPGSGQLALRQQRSAAYAVAEAYLLLQFIGARRDGDRDRLAYRQLAVDVARRQFGGSFPTGPWEYYERMEHFQESGRYNLNPGQGDFEPETDELTYNGSRWKAAREIYWRDPSSPPPRNSQEFQSALAFYKASAASDEYRWSWRDASLEQTTYQNTIASANRNYQRAVNYAGVLVMNHLTSLIDAYVSVRVRRFGGAGVVPIQVERVSLSYEPQPFHPSIAGVVAGSGVDRFGDTGQWHLEIKLGLGKP